MSRVTVGIVVNPPPTEERTLTLIVPTRLGRRFGREKKRAGVDYRDQLIRFLVPPFISAFVLFCSSHAFVRSGAFEEK